MHDESVFFFALKPGSHAAGLTALRCAVQELAPTLVQSPSIQGSSPPREAPDRERHPAHPQVPAALTRFLFPPTPDPGYTHPLPLSDFACSAHFLETGITQDVVFCVWLLSLSSVSTMRPYCGLDQRFTPFHDSVPVAASRAAFRSSVSGRCQCLCPLTSVHSRLRGCVCCPFSRG